MLKFYLFLFIFTFINSAVIRIESPFEALAFEIIGRIRLVKELGRHWSILTGEECFQVFHDNLTELSRNIDHIPTNERDTPKRYAQVICDNDELFNALMNQLVLPDVNEGKQESRHVIDVTLLELAYSYKLKLREYWTGVLSSFNECIADLDIRQVKRIFGEDEVVIEALSVRIDMICHKPEFKTAKRSIKNFLKKHKDRVH